MESYGQRSNGSQQWPPHLLSATSTGYGLTSPGGDQQYPGYYREKEAHTGGLSLNMSGLSVTSPSNLSPINNPAGPAGSSASQMSPHAADTPRSSWKGKARAQPIVFAREDLGSGGEGGIVIPLDMLQTTAYEA